MAGTWFNKKVTGRPRPCRGRFVAMDWGGRYVQMVLAEHTLRRTRLHRLVNLEMPVDLDITQPQAMGRWLGQQMRRHRFAADQALMNVPRSKTILRPLRLPQTTDEGELAGMVQYQVLRDIPYPAEEAVIDFIVGSHYQFDQGPDEPAGQTVEVLAAVIHRREIAYYQEVAEAAGLKLRRLGLRAFADVHGITRLLNPPAGEHVAVVHLAADCAEISVFSGGVLEFCQSSDLTIPRAEEQADAGQLEQARASVAQAVSNVIVQNLQIYRMSQARRSIDRLLVVGATSLEGPVAQQVSRTLDVPCQELDPAGVVSARRGRQHVPACLSAIGAAWLDGQAPHPTIDFVHPRQPSVPRTPLQRYGPPVAAVAAVLAVVLIIAVALGFSSRHQRLADAQARLASLKKAAAQADLLAGQLRAIEQWQAGSVHWLDHWAYLCQLCPPADRLYLRGLKTTGDNHLTFTAQATTPQVLEDLARRLQEAGYEYQPQRTESRANPFDYSFTLVAEIQPTERVNIDLERLPAIRRPADDISLEVFNRTGPPMAAGRPEVPTTGADQAGKTADRPADPGGRMQARAAHASKARVKHATRP